MFCRGGRGGIYLVRMRGFAEAGGGAWHGLGGSVGLQTKELKASHV